MQRFRLPVALALVLCAPCVAHAQAAPALPSDSLERGRAATRWLINGTVDSLWSIVVPAQRGIFASRESMSQAMATFTAQAGTVSGKVEERFVWRGGQRQYWHVVNVSSMPEPIQIRWVMLPDGRIGGLGINPLSAAPAVDSGGPVIKP